MSLRAARILCVSGSARAESLNTKLVHLAAAKLSSHGAKVDVLDMRKVELPVFSQELEKEGAVPQLEELKSRFNKADAFVFACPEYNGFVTPLLVNVAAWMSRPLPGQQEDMYASFSRKNAAIMAASPGGLGGLRGLNPARELFTNLGVHVLPTQVAIGGAYGAFEEVDGVMKLKNDRHAQMLDSCTEELNKLAHISANQETMCKVVHQMQQGTYGEVIV